MVSENPFKIGHAYLKTNLGLGDSSSRLVAVAGVALWVATLVLSGILAFRSPDYMPVGHEEHAKEEKKHYKVVFGFTLAAGISVLFDYGSNKANCWTVLTVFFGTVATLFAIGLWAIDTKKTMSESLVFVQAAANAIQLAAIFNNNRNPID